MTGQGGRARRFYRTLLFVYPARYRREYAEEQARLFADLRRDAARGRDRASLWIRALGDLAAGAAREHAAAFRQAAREVNMSRSGWLMLLVAAAMAAWLGYIDQKTTEVQGTLLFLLPFGFALGALRPRHAWRWALILGLSIPAAALIARFAGVEPAGLVHAREVTGRPLPFTYGQALTGLVALIPALVAVYAGAAANRLLTTARRSPG